MFQDACEDSLYNVVLDQLKSWIKTWLPLYVGVQVQGQLGICHKHWCDLVFYTEKGFVVDLIYFDELFYKEIVAKLISFFEKYLFKAVRQSSNIYQWL